MFRRMSIVFTVIILCFSVLFTRLLYLSTDNGMMAAAKSQGTATLTVAKERGNIYDRNYNNLVNEQNRYVASVNPIPKAVNTIAKQLDEKDREDFLQRINTGKPLTIELNKSINEEGINTFLLKKRYSDNQLAAHIIGYTGYDDLGITGIEKVYNDYLTEQDAKITVSYPVNAIGSPLTGIEPNIVNTIDNTTQGIMLTLDKEIQQIAEDAADKYIEKGAIVIMKVGTGDIVASVSRPTYSPNNIADYINDEDSPLLNRAFSAYNVGSVFKLVTASAALESNISPDFKYECKGSITVGSNTFGCHNRAGHGEQNMAEALAHSCNPYFINIGQQIGGDKIYNLAVSLGFGKANYFAKDYSSASGTLPEKDMLKGPAVTANFSFGQGELTATPVQICSMINTIASNGEYYTPRLIAGKVDVNKNLIEEPTTPPVQVIPEEITDIVKEFMSEVLKEGGTGYTAAPYNVIAAGKTATAQTGIMDGDREIVHSWFGGFFPYIAPQYAVAIIAEDCEDGKISTCPAFKYIAEKITELNDK